MSVLVNGSPTEEFRMEKGLRQGDPLAPFLFLIVAEGLNGLFHNVVQMGKFQGFTLGENAEFTISMLQFADDMLFIRDATIQNVTTMKCVLRCFELISGLKVNFHKSILVGARSNSLAMWEPIVIKLRGRLSAQNLEETDPVFKLVWTTPVPSNIRAFIWCLLRDRLQTRDNICKRLVIVSGDESLCPLCGQEEEFTNHLFYQCNAIYPIWYRCAEWLGVMSTLLPTPRDHLLQFSTIGGNKEQRAGEYAIQLCGIYGWLVTK
ncbi:uncharacterized protein LOC130736733 [Lotus japonicus]|uniref:uncharacterized protein LOC130736733 n=1 Tax=Lotus japonicus TaxID=34305 RepID=UPI0025889F7C|nr:uncharacterized protein LOC130736733 [Lotus japonicus]